MSEPTKIDKMRHSLAHIFAGAVLELYPGTKLAIGPAVENGFYYDVESDHTFNQDDFKKIEKAMWKVINKDLPFNGEEKDYVQAEKYWDEKHQPYKVELVRDIKERGETLTHYSHGDFTDLCKGGHMESTGQVGFFKLDRVAGAYWKGDERNSMLQRIYGLAFETEAELDAYITQREEALKRDHRKIGQELDLFAFSELVGPGLPLFTPRGNVIREELAKFVQDLMKPHGYKRVMIPHLAKSDLYKTSGHWDKFADDIFHVSSKKTDQEFIVKPMNCPHHTQIYASQPRSYRDLPIRYAEVTTVYRDENTGQLQGLSRVRSITQDDAHVFCMQSQVKEEALKIIDIVRNFYAKFGMPLKARLSVQDPEHPENYLGDKELWAKAEGQLKELLEELGEDYFMGVGEAAFYGPKIDMTATDAIGRQWQLATIQLDFNQPMRFGLSYTDEDGSSQTPVMIHRAILGSIERFMGVMIEHYAGKFPTWLAPEQVRLLPVSDKHIEFAQQFAQELMMHDIRVEVDSSHNTIGKKIRSSETQKVPYSLVIGDKEMSGENLQVRRHGQEEQKSMSKDDFMSHIKNEISERL